MKKQFLTLLLLVLAISINAQSINWVTWDEAFEMQTKKGKPIILIVTSNTGCGYCDQFDKNTLGNKDVVKYINKYFYAIRHGVLQNGSDGFTKLIGVKGFPSNLFMDKDKNYIQAPIEGNLKVPKMEFYLKYIRNSDYKKIDSQEEFDNYVKSFKPKFKE